MTTCIRTVLRHYRNAVEPVEDTLAEEHCLAVVVDDAESVRTMSTPGEDEELVLGHLFTEGRIRRPRDVRSMRFHYPGKGRTVAEVELAPEAGDGRPVSLPSGACLDAGEIFRLMRKMESMQAVFRRTGATHCAALFDKGGRILSMAEDIGRHNALDKVIGSALRDGLLDRALVATMSSRLSCELVCKAAAAGLTFLCGLSVATGLAVDLAAEKGITLAGRVRDGRMNVYSHRERVLWPQQHAEPGGRLCDSAS
ncbi:formate dehydrogenase accessory sulfurtransferase FdhD [Desulfohalovibrio reitneri]|uniref:formate dehydrogenase accessory sulfurtransferase FdhD n=1 Tax=Desulfohalovibrio reitneri TaxID=1307759 RepID=UPI00054E65B8|nr:formate dehydrogenase accessory sulfurtransferase FdhD [Desulfohalovibrio reitneri]